MSNSLKQQFNEVIKDVAREHPDYFHRKLPDIRRAMGVIDAEHPFYDAGLIEKHGIDPDEWLKTHALGFAKETLAITGYNTHPAHGETAYVRSLICLSQADEGYGAFGPALSDATPEIAQQLRDFLVLLEPYRPLLPRPPLFPRQTP